MIPWSMLRWQFFVRFLWLEAVIYTIMPLHLDWLIIPISDAYQAACCDDEPEIAYTETWLANETHWFARWWLKRILHHLPLTILEEPRFDRRIYHKMGRDMWQIGRLYQFMSLCGLYSGMLEHTASCLRITSV